MNVTRIAPMALAGLVLTACVTINVYFPAVAAERAADKIIEDVWGDAARQKEPPPQEKKDQPTSWNEAPNALRVFALSVLEQLIPAAHAQADLDTSSPAIQKIKASMEQRYSSLKPVFDSGVVGLTNDGLIAIRDPKAVPLQDRNKVKQLVADENADRSALYREIAIANNHPEWEGDIRGTFAKRWIDKAPGGWWYQDGGGAWKQK